MRVAVVGATGLIGTRLVAALRDRGDEVVPLSRGGDEVAGVPGTRWDPAEGPLAPAVLEEVGAVVNLAGAPIQGGRWTASRKRLLWDSRVATTQRLVESLRGRDGSVLVSASAVGYYGPSGDEMLAEDAPAGTDFLADLAAAWEAAALAAARDGVRVAISRTGLVLAREGGLLPVIARPVRLFVGGPLGDGRQWQPWIHADDQIGMLLTAIDDDRVQGPFNATAPEPVRQRELAKALGRVLGRPAVVPTPAFAIRIVMGEMAEIALCGQRAVPSAMRALGYEFAYEDLETALSAELGGG
jgi:uncharacterized protein (TIGR01777 family)